MAVVPFAPSDSSSTTVAEGGQANQRKSILWIQSLFQNPDKILCDYKYAGDGTSTSPYLVQFLPNDPEDAQTFSTRRKWSITLLEAMSCLAVTFASSAYSGAIRDVVRSFDVSMEVATLGVSLFVLGFAVGPLIWAPLSELYGRQMIFVITFTALTAFTVGTSCAQTMPQLLVLRFFASAFGSSSLTVAGGVITDMFNVSERGLALSIFAMAPFLGPALGQYLC